MIIDSKRLLNYLDYYKKYYGNVYFPNQGLKQICRIIYNHCSATNWLDLGGGTNTLFWSHFIKGLKKVTSVDLFPEAQIASQIISDYFEPSKCCKEVMKTIISEEINDSFEIVYDAADLLAGDYSNNECYDLVSQFGLFGLLKSSEEYINALKEYLRYVNNTGTFIGANWIFSNVYANKMGFSNDYLKDIDLNSVEEGFQLILKKYIKIKDTNYDKILIYILRRNDEH